MKWYSQQNNHVSLVIGRGVLAVRGRKILRMVIIPTLKDLYCQSIFLNFNLKKPLK
jgi:hypothetical protein